MSSTGQLPPGRYDDSATGSSLAASRFVAVLLVALVLAVLVAGGWFLYQRSQTDRVAIEPTGYEVLSDEAVSIRVDLDRSAPETPVVCIVRAREGSGAENGRREIYFPPSEHNTVRIEVEIPTVSRAVDVDAYGCGEEIPGYLDQAG